MQALILCSDLFSSSLYHADTSINNTASYIILINTPKGCPITVAGAWSLHLTPNAVTVQQLL